MERHIHKCVTDDVAVTNMGNGELVTRPSLVGVIFSYDGLFPSRRWRYLGGNERRV